MRLELRDIWAAPPGAPGDALHGASLEVAAGEWVALGGPNGSGKTTLLMVAAGLLDPRRGTRNLGGCSSVPGGPTSPPRVATILQDPSVQLFAATVADEIGLTALHLGVEPERRAEQVRKWSTLLGLEADLRRAPEKLSAGRQQLVLLAAALASEPDLLIADEPGAHLDSNSRRRVIEVLSAACRRGLGILWVTQDAEEWQAASRTISLSDSGRERRGPEAGGASAGGAPQPGGWQASGALAPSGGDEIPASTGDAPTLMRVEVSEIADLEGPCVRTSAPFELQLPSTGMVCLEGPNGAGKSVLLATVCGLMEPAQIRIRALRPLAPPPLLIGQYPERQVFEDTVGRELVFAAVARAVARPEALRRAARALARLNLEHQLALDRHSWELSTGEKRLVLLVGALIAPTALLALDEPTAGLDSNRREALAHLVTEKSRECLVLVASQDAEWVGSLPSRRRALQAP